MFTTEALIAIPVWQPLPCHHLLTIWLPTIALNLPEWNKSGEMINVIRSPHNPILAPRKRRTWEREAAFNPSAVMDNSVWHIVYRAQSAPQPWANTAISIASVGYAYSQDGENFLGRKQLFGPSQDWDRFGCEDPRITKIGNTFYIFYTALSVYPFAAPGIKVAVAKTQNFKDFEKHLATPFNAKAMALFPSPVSGKLTAILTAHTDSPPAVVSIAQFDRESDIWSKDYWENWHKNLKDHELVLTRSGNDHVEVGAPPVLTDRGWLLIYSYIYNYFSTPATFAIEAVLLSGDHPQKVIARCRQPLLIPAEHYELYGKVPSIVFPTGADLKDGELSIFYGAADTTCCLAHVSLSSLFSDMLPLSNGIPFSEYVSSVAVERSKQNPIVIPVKSHKWESRYAFNPGAIFECGKIHLLYRAMGEDNLSVLGYASSADGVHIDERIPEPVYTPREGFEKPAAGGSGGCEDARITRLGDRIYICYTAYNAKDPPRVALSSISVDDFCAKKWNWQKPVLISPPGVDDKDACLLPEKVEGKFVFLHRFNPSIWVASVDKMEFGERSWLG